MYILNLYGELFSKQENTAWKRGVKALAMALVTDAIRNNGCDVFIGETWGAVSLYKIHDQLFKGQSYMEYATAQNWTSQSIANILLPYKAALKYGRMYKPPYGSVYNSWNEMLAFGYKAAWELIVKEVTYWNNSFANETQQKEITDVPKD